MECVRAAQNFGADLSLLVREGKGVIDCGAAAALESLMAFNRQK